MKLSRHHTYPKKWRNGNSEIKLVTDKEHRAWHILVGDEHPINAMKILANKFLPSDMEKEYQREVKR
ncbi:MAG: hypothetical protein P1P85_04125 [Patescibacteria group bacterium]|nr:hypothetical protein [Patescibacteria group bacterium]